MKHIPAILFVSCLLLLVSCSKELITPLNSDKIAIVESYLYAGDSAITVKVSKVLPFSEDTLAAIEYISGLNLNINGYALTETYPGIYKFYLGTGKIVSDSSYTLKFRFNSDTVSSTTTIPRAPANFSISATTVYTDRITSSSGFPGGPMEDIDLTWDNDDDSYFYVTVEYLESTPDYINSSMEEYELPMVQSISPVQSSGTRLSMRNLQFFGRYRIVLFKVNKDFADLYQHITANSNNLVSPVTSIVNGYGVFTGMSSDTAYLRVREN